MTNSNLWPGSSTAAANPRGKVSLGPGSPESQWKEKLRDGATVLIRPVHAEDVDIKRRFIEVLSSQSQRFHFLGEIKTPSSALLAQLTHPDPARDAAFVVLIADGANKREIGVGRFSARRWSGLRMARSP